MLWTTGLRREAVARLCVVDVWDPAPGCVRQDAIEATEKFGSTRTIRPVPAALRQHLDRYLRSPTESPLLLQGGAAPLLLLFPPPPGSMRAGAFDPGRPSPSTVTTTLQRLCRRAGIHPPFRPHQFRSFVVDDVLARGGTLAEASRLLGHRSMDVTFHHYVSAPGRDRIPMLDEGAGGDPDDRWELLQTARVALENRLRDLGHPPPPS